MSRHICTKPAGEPHECPVCLAALPFLTEARAVLAEAARMVEAEREACAKVADWYAGDVSRPDKPDAGCLIANAIRRRRFVQPIRPRADAAFRK